MVHDVTRGGRAAWIPKREAIGMVLAAQRPDAISGRSGALSLLGLWARRGVVRTKADLASTPSWAKRPRRLYRRADIAARIARRPRWTPAEDAQLGTDIDRVVAERVGRCAEAVAQRRLKLGIPSSGPSTKRW